MAYEINYDDKRFAQVEADKKAALTDVEETYGGMINESDKYYKDQIDATVEWGDKQAQLQQEQTDFAIEKIEQQKAQTEKDYHKEQSAAYVDYQKQIDPYGVNAEQMAANGLKNTGYSESSKVAMYNAYQNRVAVAKESFNQAKLEYDNMMTEARLQNSAALAEIAYTTLQTKLQLALEGFQYKNSLLIEQANQKTNVENTYYARWQDVLDQINTENALAEEKRQFNASLAEERRQFNASLEAEQAATAMIDSGDDNPVNYFLTIEDAANYMAKNGISKASDVKLYDARTWKNMKGSGEKGDEFLFDTYADYLTAYVAYCEKETKS